MSQREKERESQSQRKKGRGRTGCGAEMPSCERRPSVGLGRMKEKEVIVASC